MEQEKRNLSFVFERNKNAITVPVSGAFGGPGTDHPGVVVHFYIEYQSLPNIIDVEIPKDAPVFDSNLGKRISRGDITREVQATFYMTTQAARSIGHFLIEKADLIESRAKK
jgi:hypothetical protein